MHPLEFDIPQENGVLAVIKGGHNWPGGSTPPIPETGEATEAISATEALMELMGY